MAYAYDAGMIDRILPRIKQYEATTGRKISQSMLDALMKGQLSTEVDKAQQTRALDLQESQFASQQEQQKKANKAAMVKGGVDVLTTGATLGLTYKALSRPSAMSELIAYQKSIGGTTAATPGTMVAANAPAYTAPASTAGSLTAGTSGVEYGSAIGAGAQTALAGGAPVAIGGQAALASGGSAVGMSAPEAAYLGTEGFVAPAATGSGFGLSSLVLPVAGAYAGSELYKAIFKEDLGQDIKRTTQKIGHEIADVGRSVANVAKDIGSAIGDIFGW